MQELTKEILKNSKWRVNPGQSKRLQEKSFEVGASWWGPSRKNNTESAEYIDSPGLFFDDILNISHCTELIKDDWSFDEAQFTERKFEDYFEEMVMDHVAPGVKIKKFHEEGDVTVIDDAELISLSTVPHPEPICKIQGDVQKSLGKKVAEAEEAAIKEFAKKHIQMNIKDNDKIGIVFKYPEGSFMWAAEQMKQGNKVQRLSTGNKHWNLMMSRKLGEKGFYFYSHMKDPDYDRWHPSEEMITATDWKIYEDGRSLSDKSWSGICMEKDDEYYLEADVKKSVERLKQILPKLQVPGESRTMLSFLQQEVLWKEIDKIFGGRLT